MAAAAAGDIQEFLDREQQKELLRFTTAGSVDDGKSTLIGRLLYDSKGVYEDQLASVRKASANRNAGPIDFSLLTDGLRAEREQGITIDVAYRYFSTPGRKFIIADTPGHEQYTRNMATGASTAQLAIVLVDARKGILPQSRRHAYIAALLGIPSVVVAVNKMDLVDFSREVFENIRTEFEEFVRELGIRRQHFIPISALEGDNVVTESARTPWYSGGSLLRYLETVPIETAAAAAMRFPVQYVIRPSLDFRGYAGQIVSGTICRGQEIVVLPSGRTSRVKSIVTFDGELEEASAPLSVTVALEDEIDISRGDMLAAPGEAPLMSRHFEAQVVWMHAEALRLHRPYLLKHTTQQVTASVADLLHRTDVNTLASQPASKLELNEIGSVRIETRKPLYFDAYAENRSTGAFIFIDPITNATVGAGMITRSATPERTGLRVTEAERRKRFGHGPASVALPGRTDLAHLLERELFERGCAVHVIEAEAPGALLEAFRAAGLIAICTEQTETEVVFESLPDDDNEALKAILSQMERRGVIRREGLGPDGEGI